MLMHSGLVDGTYALVSTGLCVVVVLIVVALWRR